MDCHVTVRGRNSLEHLPTVGYARPAGVVRSEGKAVHPYAFDPQWTLAQQTLRRLFAGDASLGLPVVLWGHVGVGKTRLIDEVLTATGCAMPLCETADDFSRGYVFARRHEQHGRLEAWRRARLEAALWVMEDVEELAGRNGSQQELSRLIDSRQCCEAPLLVTSRDWPLDRDAFRPALLSRLAGGLVLELAPASHETRAAWVNAFAAQRGAAFTATAAATLAEKFPLAWAPLRQACEALLRETARMEGAVIDEALVAGFLAARQATVQPALRRIATLAAKEFGVLLGDLRSSSRQQNLVAARGAVVWLARRVTNLSLVEIGKFFGGRDHATVLHAQRSTATRCESDHEFAERLARLERKLTET